MATPGRLATNLWQAGLDFLVRDRDEAKLLRHQQQLNLRTAYAYLMEQLNCYFSRVSDEGCARVDART